MRIGWCAMSEHVVKVQTIDLTDMVLEGKILDIGGGGEGIISRHSGQSVVAIDLRNDELKESPDIGLKIVMDACDMSFLDNTFDTVTSFFTLLYMDEASIIKFAAEAYRVIKPNGALRIWDTRIPPLSQGDVFVVQLEIHIDSQNVVNTGYGIGWSREQKPESIVEILENAGLTTVMRRDNGHIFELCFKK